MHSKCIYTCPTLNQLSNQPNQTRQEMRHNHYKKKLSFLFLFIILLSIGQNALAGGEDSATAYLRAMQEAEKTFGSKSKTKDYERARAKKWSKLRSRSEKGRLLQGKIQELMKITDVAERLEKLKEFLPENMEGRTSKENAKFGEVQLKLQKLLKNSTNPFEMEFILRLIARRLMYAKKLPKLPNIKGVGNLTIGQHIDIIVDIYKNPKYPAGLRAAAGHALLELTFFHKIAMQAAIKGDVIDIWKEIVSKKSKMTKAELKAQAQFIEVTTALRYMVERTDRHPSTIDPIGIMRRAAWDIMMDLYEHLPDDLKERMTSIKERGGNAFSQEDYDAMIDWISDAKEIHRGSSHNDILTRTMLTSADIDAANVYEVFHTRLSAESKSRVLAMKPGAKAPEDFKVGELVKEVRLELNKRVLVGSYQKLRRMRRTIIGRGPRK